MEAQQAALARFAEAEGYSLIETFQEVETGKGADALDRSMLDLVLGGAKDLRGKLSRTDQHKLDEYLDSVRAVERRIEWDAKRQGEHGEGREPRAP